MNIFKQRAENQAIASAIDFFENGPFSETEWYIKALTKGEKVQLNGFIFTRDTYCYCIWKNDPNPRYKDQPLLKVVPRHSLKVKQIIKILSAQPWEYI